MRALDGPRADGEAEGRTSVALGDENRRRVLDCFLAHDHIGLTQAEIADLVGLSRPAVFNIIRQLDSVLVARGSRASRTGRPAQVYRLRRDLGLAASIDLGPGHLRAAVSNGFVDSADLPEGAGDRREDRDADLPLAIGEGAELLSKALQRRRGRQPPLVGVALSLAMPVSRHGIVRQPGRWAGIDAQDLLRKALHRAGITTDNVFVGNDADLGCLAEARFGAGREASTVMYLKWSRRLTLGIVVEGRIMRGARGIAGEIGHIRLPGATAEGGPVCEQCKMVCLDTRVGLDALRGKRRCGDFLKDAARHTGSTAKKLEEAAALVGRFLAPTVGALNPDRIVLGGLLGANHPGLVKPLEDALRESIWIQMTDLSVDTGAWSRYAALRGGLVAVVDEFLVPALVRRTRAPQPRGSTPSTRKAAAAAGTRKAASTGKAAGTASPRKRRAALRVR